MSKQPEALRLADELTIVHNGHADEGPSTFSESAAELRSLHSHAEKADALLREVRQTLDNRLLTDIFGYEFVQKLEDHFETNMEDFF